MAINCLNLIITFINYVVSFLDELYIVPNFISLGTIIEYYMIITVVIWVIGGMIRHNGNS